MESTQIAAGLTPVSPARPVAAYIGGKRNLSQVVIERISSLPHKLYAEPFVGMGGVFLRRQWRPPAEAVNDISTDIVTLFRILQRHYQSFLEELKWRLSSRAEFERLMATDPTTLTDIERSARFLYLQRTAFGGKVVGRTFGVSKSGSRFDITKLAPMLADVHERLSGVVIERLPYDDFIRRYDSADTLYYLDPPYNGSEGYYGPSFSADDFESLRGRLASIKGRFIMSINDTPMIRDIFAEFDIQEVRHRFGVAGSSEARELVIAGV